MVMETFVALAYKHLSPEHYAFKLLGPVSGDVGFVNRSWGMDPGIEHGGMAYIKGFNVVSFRSWRIVDKWEFPKIGDPNIVP